MDQETAIAEPPQGSGDKFFTKPIIIIFVTILIDLIGFGIVIPVLPYYLESDAFNGTPLQLGWLLASYSIMQFIFSPILGAISDKYGRRPVLFFSLLGTAVGLFMIGFANTMLLIFAGRILDGMTGGNISTAQAYIADVTTRENRAKGMGLVGASFGIGFVLGPAIGGILSKYGNSVPFFFAGALSLANAAALYFFLPESLKKGSVVATRKVNRLAEILNSFADSRFRIITIVYSLVVVGFSIMTTAFVLFTMKRFGYDAEQNGYLFVYIGVLAVVIQGGLFGRLSKWLGETRLVAIGCLLLTVSLFAVPFVGRESGGLVALLIGIAFFSIGNSIASPALTSLASKNASDADQGKALGVMQSGASLARAIGPVVAGYLLNNAIGELDDMTIRRTFFTASGIMLCAFIVSVFYMRTWKAEPVAA